MEEMEAPIAEVKQGKLKGTFRRNLDGRKFNCFLGIPFGEPPLGDLRFKAPVPARPWTSIRDATKQGGMSFSKDERTGKPGGSEDCLHLNVFTRSLPPKDARLKPVMVYIYGGGFIGGTNNPDSCGPEFLMLEDIVLVMISYRTGVLGFLNLEDPSLGVPGNAGLKDQVLALKWVQENIQNFNGNPKNVTIFGHSAGSASVHYLILSPAAKGLFHKAILQSGTTLNTLTIGYPFAKEIVEHLGGKVNDEKEALDFLRSIPAELLVEAREKMSDIIRASWNKPIAPVIEYPNETSIITRPAIDIIKSGEYNKVPMIFGYTTREAMMRELDIIELTDLGMPVPTLTLEDAIPWTMKLEKEGEKTKSICKMLEEFYLNEKNKDDIYLLDSDSLFVSAIIAAARNHSLTSHEPIYLYRVSLEARLNLLKNILKLNDVPGVCHGDELGYLFKTRQTCDFERGSIEDISIKRFVKLWTNFAKYGNPTPFENEMGIIWKPVEGDDLNFMDIGRELVSGVNPEQERIALWKKIYQMSSETADYL